MAPDLPFGGDNSNAIKASGVFGKKEDRLWLPVSAYLIEHPKGKFLVDTGWGREMSPNGEFDKTAQIKSLGSVMLYEVASAWASASTSSCSRWASGTPILTPYC